ncbi:hypothetical protein HPB51_007465 [Rhipicephalus microplus]|uniref:Copper homeostasis protein cutC homolog n=1 Tax=Rhipicephalus microplus TaxID=6941 RepID=A0A9J6E085_RHIMP|nr:hypothetical protein HPB51_007465 [Rhipicephalus microplus]
MAFELEVCVDSVASALTAAESGATRLEVCAGLAVGGLTPSFGKLCVQVLICLPGGYCIEGSLSAAVSFIRTIFSHIRNGAHGFVIGALTREGDVDMRTCQRLLVAAGPQADTTFHRAFDVARNPQTALEQVIELGFRRLLTSGQAASVEHGLELLARLASQSR